jgi:hypothetical protein
MLKRLRVEAARQDWFAVAVEFVILVLGVFLGIQVNNWNQGRLDRAEGREYRHRLIADLESNQRDLAFRIHYDGQALGHARAAIAALDRPVGSDPGQFVLDAYEASNHIPQALRQFTYDEAVAAGKAERLGEPRLREKVANYYVGVATMQRLFDYTPAYRDLIRSALPYEAQVQAMKDCPEVLKSDEFGTVTPRLADNCRSTMDPNAAAREAAEVRTIPNLKWALNRVVADLAQNIANARILSDQAGQLKTEVRQAERKGTAQ